MKRYVFLIIIPHFCYNNQYRFTECDGHDSAQHRVWDSGEEGSSFQPDPEKDAHCAQNLDHQPATHLVGEKIGNKRTNSCEQRKITTSQT